MLDDMWMMMIKLNILSGKIMDEIEGEKDGRFERKFDGQRKAQEMIEIGGTRMGEMEAKTHSSKKLMNKIIHL